MFFNQSNGKSKAAAGRQLKLHTITGLSKEREFAGSFTLGSASYNFSYAPSKGEIRDGKFYLAGKLTVSSSRGRALHRDGVRALCAGIQGGLGAAPPRLATGDAIQAFEMKRLGTSDPSSPQQQRALPVVEFTGPRSFPGVMYLILDPLEGRELGVPADMSRVQLNARFYVVDDKARTLHGIYASIIDALDQSFADQAAAAAFITELNKSLTSA
jgi:hypothetical protein